MPKMYDARVIQNQGKNDVKPPNQKMNGIENRR
jgi:hypothetical protein